MRPFNSLVIVLILKFQLLYLPFLTPISLPLPLFPHPNPLSLHPHLPSYLPFCLLLYLLKNLLYLAVFFLFPLLSVSLFLPTWLSLPFTCLLLPPLLPSLFSTYLFVPLSPSTTNYPSSHSSSPLSPPSLSPVPAVLPGYPSN